jgi:hypothetical protein
VVRPDPETVEASRTGRNLFRHPKTYPSLEEAVGHFHLVPPQPRRHPWLLDQVARDSLRQVEDGWTWKFDPNLFVTRSGPRHPSEFGPQLARAACRLAVISGERSAIVDEGVIDHMRELVAGSPAAAAGVPVRAHPRRLPPPAARRAAGHRHRDPRDPRDLVPGRGRSARRRRGAAG